MPKCVAGGQAQGHPKAGILTPSPPFWESRCIHLCRQAWSKGDRVQWARLATHAALEVPGTAVWCQPNELACDSGMCADRNT